MLYAMLQIRRTGLLPHPRKLQGSNVSRPRSPPFLSLCLSLSLLLVSAWATAIAAVAAPSCRCGVLRRCRLLATNPHSIELFCTMAGMVSMHRTPSPTNRISHALHDITLTSSLVAVCVCWKSYDEYGTVDEYGSYPASSFEEDAASILNDATSTRPRILLMGSRRSGKSSIQKVVFHKMSPHETLFLESTNDIRVRDVQTSALLHFHLLDFPGGYEFNGRAASSSGVTAEKIFKRQGTLVFVIDAQDDENQFSESIDYFLSLARTAYTTNPHLHYAILIHKVDGDSYVSEEHKSDCHTEIKKTVTEELSEAALPIHPQFYMTSIYDHSIFEAMSKIVQQLIPQLSVLETLLDGLIVSCAMDKAFLFDIVSKIYIATDSNPVDMQTYELCSDMIDVVIDVSCIYGIERTASGVQRMESGAQAGGQRRAGLRRGQWQ